MAKCAVKNQYGETVDWIDVDLDYADDHESGQLRLGVPGEQRSLLPLEDSLIPASPTARDEDVQS